MADLRVRFDDSFNEIIEEIRSNTFLDNLSKVSLFCAALGYSNGAMHTRQRGNLDVRLSVLENSLGATELIDALAVDHFLEENGRLPESEMEQEVKLAIFEAYVNGGLSTLVERKRTGKSVSSEVNLIINANVDLLSPAPPENLPSFD